MRTIAAFGLMVLLLVAGRAGPAAAADPSVVPTSLSAPQETVTVMGRRHGFRLAPPPDHRLVQPGRSGFGPGGTVGAWTIEGDLFHHHLPNGMSIGATLHVPGVDELDLVLGATGNGGAFTPVATPGTATVTVGRRLTFRMRRTASGANHPIEPTRPAE